MADYEDLNLEGKIQLLSDNISFSDDNIGCSNDNGRLLKLRAELMASLRKDLQKESPTLCVNASPKLTSAFYALTRITGDSGTSLVVDYTFNPALPVASNQRIPLADTVSWVCQYKEKIMLPLGDIEAKFLETAAEWAVELSSVDAIENIAEQYLREASTLRPLPIAALNVFKKLQTTPCDIESGSKSFLDACSLRYQGTEFNQILSTIPSEYEGERDPWAAQLEAAVKFQKLIQDVKDLSDTQTASPDPSRIDPALKVFDPLKLDKAVAVLKDSGEVLNESVAKKIAAYCKPALSEKLGKNPPEPRWRLRWPLHREPPEQR